MDLLRLTCSVAIQGTVDVVRMIGQDLKILATLDAYLGHFANPTFPRTLHRAELRPDGFRGILDVTHLTGVIGLEYCFGVCKVAWPGAILLSGGLSFQRFHDIEGMKA